MPSQSKQISIFNFYCSIQIHTTTIIIDDVLPYPNARAVNESFAHRMGWCAMVIRVIALKKKERLLWLPHSKFIITIISYKSSNFLTNNPDPPTSYLVNKHPISDNKQTNKQTSINLNRVLNLIFEKLSFVNPRLYHGRR